ncbi:hypothetical protein AC1031_000616 [Aphanomyces cochlioides]|nr:hypothetical protein AC1031_000616 [Aphanomyces cochlioides]
MASARRPPNEKTRLISKPREIEMYSFSGHSYYEAIDMTPDLVPIKQEVVEISSMAVQLSVRQLVRQMMLVTDVAFQGHIGTKQLAGATLAGVYMAVPSAFIQNAIPAISTLCSQAHSGGNHHLVGVWLQTCIVFAVLGAMPIMIYYLFVGDIIAITLDDTETVQYGEQFARIMAVGLIPQYLYSCLTTYFAAQGIVMEATVCSSITVVLNVVLNQVFIYGVWGIPGLGFVGSPIATVVASCLQLAMFATYTVWYKKLHRKTWGGWSWECVSKKQLVIFLPLAVPMGITSVIEWSSVALASAFSALLGTDIAACQAVLYGIWGVINSFVSGFSTATQIRMARYLSEGSAVGTKRVLSVGSATAGTIGILMVLGVYFAKDALFRLWSPDPTILALCNSALDVFCLCMSVAFCRFMMTACLHGLSMSNVNLIATNMATWGVYIPLCYVLPVSLGWSLTGFWVADCVGELVKIAILFCGLARVNWRAAADYAHKSAAVNAADEEHRELIAFENEALLTPQTFRSPMIHVGSNHTPSVAQRAMSLTPKLGRRHHDRDEEIHV